MNRQLSKLRPFTRLYSDDAHKYSHTLVLPKTKFSAKSSATKNKEYLEQSTTKVYEYQLKQDINQFKDPNVFILHDGPPYANGSLHLGHSINKILKDIINRVQLLNNKRKILYVPGFDCHGLPIELKAVKSTSTKLSATQVRKLAKEHALKTIESQTETFKKFGVMGDWEHSYKTLETKYEVEQLKIFQKMFEKNLIRRQKKPVFWGCETKTALAEGELEYNEKHKSTAAYIQFALSKPSETFAQTLKDEGVAESSINFLIWTSTPWTIVANKAICVNESFNYTLLLNEENGEQLVVLDDLKDDILEVLPDTYKATGITISGSSLIGSKYKHPLVSGEYPVLHGDHVTVAGTGLVHTAPGHGHEDYLVGINNGLEIYSPVTESGTYSSDVPESLDFLKGMKVLSEGNKKMLQLLKDSGALKHQSTLIHSYPYDWRSKKPIVIRSTMQWFTDLSEVKDRALNAIEKVNFYPERGRNRLSSFIGNRTEWCISRQRVWGVPIPVFYYKDSGEALISSETVSYIIEQLEKGHKSTDDWFSESDDVSEWLPDKLKHLADSLYKGTDTVDVWFDSGSSWSAIEKQYMSEQVDFEKRGYFADVYLEGSDQHRGWFQSSLLTKIATGETEAPYKTIVTHGFTLDSKGLKMSKSIGNTIDPVDVIEGLRKLPRLGVDGLRLWVASADYTNDITMSPLILKHVADHIKKLRITFRFLLGNLSSGSAPKSSQIEYQAIDKYILSKLGILVQECDKFYEQFQFNKAVQKINYFTNIELSSIYFSIVKDRLYCDDQNSVSVITCKNVLEQILNVYLYLLSPLLPVMTQEVWSHLPETAKNGAISPILANYDFSHLHTDEQAIEFFEQKIWPLKDEAQKLMESARNDKVLKSSLEATLAIEGENSFGISEDELADLLLVSKVKFGASNGKYNSITDINGKGVKIAIELSEDGKCPRCWKFRVEPEKEVCGRCEQIVNI